MGVTAQDATHAHRIRVDDATFELRIRLACAAYGRIEMLTILISTRARRERSMPCNARESATPPLSACEAPAAHLPLVGVSPTVLLRAVWYAVSMGSDSEVCSRSKRDRCKTYLLALHLLLQSVAKLVGNILGSLDNPVVGSIAHEARIRLACVERAIDKRTEVVLRLIVRHAVSKRADCNKTATQQRSAGKTYGVVPLDAALALLGTCAKGDRANTGMLCYAVSMQRAGALQARR